MARPKIILNHAGIAQMLKSPEVSRELNRRAQLVAARARSSVPVKTGALRDSIQVVNAPTPNRARARVVLATPYAATIAATHPAILASLDAAKE